MTFALASREQKLSIFQMSASKRCPACGGAKNRLHWLCIPCQAAVDATPENATLTIACSAHAFAAASLVDLARRMRAGGPF